MLYRTTPTDQHRGGWEEVGQQEGRKKRLKRRSSPHMTESAMNDRNQKLGKVGVEDEDKESMDEGNNVRYLRMN
jgi:hypothetical protein